jgi:hypothetical protein
MPKVRRPIRAILFHNAAENQIDPGEVLFAVVVTGEVLGDFSEPSNVMLELSDEPLDRGKDSFPPSVVTLKPSIVTLELPASRWIGGKTLSLLPS